MPPIRSADDLFRHLLYPDLLPLNTHPWFDCRQYLIQTGQLGVNGPHPILVFLQSRSLQQKSYSTDSNFQVPWLIALGAHLDRRNESHLPEVISRLHPGLFLADPHASLGHPSEGRDQLIANEKYLREIQELFEFWPDSDSILPLTWLSQQPNVRELGLTDIKPATGYQLWWVSGHWEAQVLADLAGAEISQSREFVRPEELYEELFKIGIHPSATSHGLLIALTEPLLELFIDGSLLLPDGVGILNMVWPRPSQQSAWLHLLAHIHWWWSAAHQLTFFRGLGFKAEWPRQCHQSFSSG